MSKSESTEYSDEENIIIHQDESDCLSNLEQLDLEDFSDGTDISFDEDFLNDIDSDSDIDLKVLLKYGYLIDIDGQDEIRLDITDEKIIDTGLVTGLKQGDELVDAIFIGNNKMEKLKNNIYFEKDFLKANGKKYDYDEITVQMTSNEAIIVSNKNNEFIIKLEDDAHDMFSSLVGVDEDNTCVISVIDSKVCACYISDSEVLWVNPIDIGKNKFDEKNSIIITRKKEKYHLDQCYLRACIKKIYLHVDNNNPPRTLILGNTYNPFYEDYLDETEESSDIEKNELISKKVDKNYDV